MSEHFKTLALVAQPQAGDEKRENSARLVVGECENTVVLVQENAQQSPRSDTTESSYLFDRVISLADSRGDALYRQSVKEVVEASLLGYHGTIISLSAVEEPDVERDSRFSTLICKAAGQIFRTLKRSRRRWSGPGHRPAGVAPGVALGVLCSCVMLYREKPYDLLEGYGKEDATTPAIRDLAELQAPAGTISVGGGQVIGAALLEAKSAMEIISLLHYASLKRERFVIGSDSATEACLHHTIFRLTVEFTQFGSVRAPVSGDLSFVALSAMGPLTRRQSFTTGDSIDSSVQSLFAFADVIHSLTSSLYSSTDNRKEEEEEEEELAHVPQTDCPAAVDGSVLTRLLREALGGNCKSLLVCWVPCGVNAEELKEATVVLSLASRARLIINSPNRRDHAERALMSAYMKELHARYGQEQTNVPTHTKHASNSDRKSSAVKQTLSSHVEECGLLQSGSRDSLGSAEMDSACGDLVSLSEGEQRKKTVTLAATALAAAVMSAEGEDSSSEEEEEEEVARPVSMPRPSPLGPRASAESSASATMGALVAMLQDPDRGVTRARSSALKDVHIRRGAGAVFSGADIVRWLMCSVPGVEEEEDAQHLGQLLLERGAIFHSEGSMCFANADTLFYYAREARHEAGSLSLHDVQALLGETQQHSRQAASTEHAAASTGHAAAATGTEPTVGEGTAIEGRGGLHVDREQCHAATSGSTVQSGPEQKQALPSEHSELDTQSAGHVEECGADVSLQSRGLSRQPSLESWMQNEQPEPEGAGVGRAGPEPEGAGVGGAGPEPEGADVGGAEPNPGSAHTLPSVHTLQVTADYPHPLHMAAAVGKPHGVLKNLTMMFGVNTRDERGRTPLMFAALGNKRSSCSTLIGCSAELDGQDASGLTALHVACYHGSKDALSILLAKGASVAITDNAGHSGLHWATLPPTAQCLEQLLRHAPKDMIGCVDSNKLTAVHWAIYYDKAEHLGYLLKRYEHPLERDAAGRTLMSYTIQCRAEKCLRVLMAACPSLASSLDSSGCSPLHHASSASSPVYLRALLASKSSAEPASQRLSVCDHQLRTPLHYAVAWEREENVNLLVCAGASVTALDCDKRTPLDYATSLDQGSGLVAILQGSTASLPASTLHDPYSNTKSKLCTIL